AERANRDVEFVAAGGDDAVAVQVDDHAADSGQRQTGRRAQVVLARDVDVAEKLLVLELRRRAEWLERDQAMPREADGDTADLVVLLADRHVGADVEE